LKHQNLIYSHLLEINIKFTYNYVVNSAAFLSFWRVKDEVHEEFLNLFKDRYSLSSALYAYEDQLYINIVDE